MSCSFRPTKKAITKFIRTAFGGSADHHKPPDSSPIRWMEYEVDDTKARVQRDLIGSTIVWMKTFDPEETEEYIGQKTNDRNPKHWMQVTIMISAAPPGITFVDTYGTKLETLSTAFLQELLIVDHSDQKRYLLRFIIHDTLYLLYRIKDGKKVRNHLVQSLHLVRSLGLAYRGLDCGVVPNGILQDLKNTCDIAKSTGMMSPHIRSRLIHCIRQLMAVRKYSMSREEIERFLEISMVFFDEDNEIPLELVFIFQDYITSNDNCKPNILKDIYLMMQDSITRHNLLTNSVYPLVSSIIKIEENSKAFCDLFFSLNNPHVDENKIVIFSKILTQKCLDLYICYAQPYYASDAAKCMPHAADNTCKPKGGVNVVKLYFRARPYIDFITNIARTEAGCVEVTSLLKLVNHSQSVFSLEDQKSLFRPLVAQLFAVSGRKLIAKLYNVESSGLLGMFKPDVSLENLNDEDDKVYFTIVRSLNIAHEDDADAPNYLIEINNHHMDVMLSPLYRQNSVVKETCSRLAKRMKLDSSKKESLVLISVGRSTIISNHLRVHRRAQITLGGSADDDDMEMFVKHPGFKRNLQELDACNSKITSESAKSITECENLQKLNVEGTEFSDSGLIEIATSNMMNLTAIRLTDSPNVLRGIGAVRDMPSQPRVELCDKRSIHMPQLADGSVEMLIKNYHNFVQPDFLETAL